MSSVAIFDRYALYYELFYTDKDYALESEFVKAKISAYAPQAKSIIDLGCGNARHTTQFAAAGYGVKGVDISPGMLDLARASVSRLPENTRPRVTLVQADVSNAVGLGIFDVAVSLFHVVNYQTTDESLAGFFKTARAALRPGGVFIFDFWYGPAVLHDRPERRVKSLSKDGTQVIRTATPEMDVERNIVAVHYDVTISNGLRSEAAHIHETHIMRYLFAPEIERHASHCGFKICETGGWMTDKGLDETTWYGYAVLVAH